MDSPTSAPPEEKTPLNLDSTLGAELDKLANKHSSTLSTPVENLSSVENKAEQIKSSVARLSSNSVDELEALVSELQKMQEFLKAEVERVQIQIDGALAGINIIVDTIRPWQRITRPQAPPDGTRSVRVAAVEASLRNIQRAIEPRGTH